MRKTYNAKLVPMETQPKDNDIVVTELGHVSIYSERGAWSYEIAQRLVITDEAGKQVALYPPAHIPDTHCIDLSDIRRWIDEGCKESVELEVQETFRGYLQYKRSNGISLKLTNNTVKMVFDVKMSKMFRWGQEQTEQPQQVAGEVVRGSLEHQVKDLENRLYKAGVDNAKLIGRITELECKQHPPIDWDALEGKFNKWYSNQPTSVTGIDIFNFFKNEINGK
jgi:hypothetical protein